jgi:type II secretory pathway component PulJ
VNLNSLLPVRSIRPAATARCALCVRRVAFSLIEIMITTALLSLIILGLLAMFTQTQRAFRQSMTNADVMEAGRALVDMITRDLEQITPSRMAFTTNYFAEIPRGFKVLTQGLAGTGQPGGRQDLRTNVVQRIFFLTQANQDWVGIGYQVIPDTTSSSWIGTLYRYSTNGSRYTAYYLPTAFLQAPLARLDRIADGIVHLRLRAFATNGLPIMPAGFQINPNQYLRIKNATNYMDIGPYTPDQVNSYFVSNAVPAYLELELGIMEPRIVERFKSIGNPTAQYEYLSNHVAQVHLFRQRIPIRNVDFSAYQ